MSDLQDQLCGFLLDREATQAALEKKEFFSVDNEDDKEDVVLSMTAKCKKDISDELTRNALCELPVYFEELFSIEPKEKFCDLSNKDAQKITKAANALMWELHEKLIEANRIALDEKNV